MKKIIEIDNYL